MRVRLVFFLLSFVYLIGCSGTPKTSEKVKPNVLLIVLDTLRADHLGAYGYSRNTSPNLDKFARENTLFKYAVTAAPWTPPSISAILSGLYPSSHQMMPPNNRDKARDGSYRLKGNVNLISEILKGWGYKTGYVSPNPWITEEFGFNQGFDDFKYLYRERAELISKGALELLDQWQKPVLEHENDKQKPFFLVVHYLDPHDPYDPPGAYKQMFSGQPEGVDFVYPEKTLRSLNLYDGEISYLDSELGKLFAALKSRGIYDELNIIIVSDHGEQFKEHGDQRHGYKVHNEEAHVVLMLKSGRKEDRHRVVNKTVSTIDIYPTIVDLVGLESPSHYQGVSLLKDNQIAARAGVLTEIRRVYDQKSFTNIDGKKIVFDIPLNEGDSPEAILSKWDAPRTVGIYDGIADPLEQHPLDDNSLATSLRAGLVSVWKRARESRVEGEEVTGQVKDETLERLKSLGYLQ